MDNFDWLRLGGMIAQRWPKIDFDTVDIRRVGVEYSVYALPVLPDEIPIPTDEGAIPTELKIENEVIKMTKWVSGNEKCRVGYGSKSSVLLVSY